MPETLSLPKRERSWRGMFAAFAVLCMLDSVALYYAGNFTNLLFTMVLMPLTFVFAGAVVFNTELVRQWSFRILLVFLAWFFLSIAVSELDAGAFLDNRPYLYVLCMQIFVFFPLGAALSGRSLRMTLRIMAYFTILVVLALDAFGIYAACTNQYFEKTMGADYGVGVFTATVLDSAYHRLTTLYHPNTVGMFSSLAALLSLYLIASARRNALLRWFHALTLPVFFVCIAMSNSRTSMVCFALGASLFLFRVLWLKPAYRTVLLRWVASLAAAGAMCALLLVLYSPANALMERISVAQKAHAGESAASVSIEGAVTPAVTEMPNTYVDSATAVAEEALGEDTLIQERPIDTEMLAMSGRTTIWRIALETLITSPRRILLGISPAQVGPQIGPKLNIWTTEMHSSFVQILVSCGVVGLLLFAVFLCLLAIGCARRFFGADTDELRSGYLVIPLVCLLLGAVPETFLLVYHFPHLASMWFFLLAGIILRPRLTGAALPSKSNH